MQDFIIKRLIYASLYVNLWVIIKNKILSYYKNLKKNTKPQIKNILI